MYKKKCRHHFLKLLQTNERRLRFAIDQLDVKTITLDSELGKTVRNINTISELKDLKHEFED